jgi:hypothetical protein
MTIQEITNTIKIIIDGRKMGRVSVVRDGSNFEVRAFILNSDGIGKRDTLLASFADVNTAISVQRALMM